MNKTFYEKTMKKIMQVWKQQGEMNLYKSRINSGKYLYNCFDQDIDL